MIPRSPLHLIRNPHGVSLAELLIAVALVGIGIMGAVSGFNIIQKSIQHSKSSTLAGNLAQEKMQIIMQKTYFEILVTADPAYDTRFSPSIPYDTLYFPPETILEGGISFTRYTVVEVVTENPPVIQVLPPTTPDTGMRQITVTVLWTQGSEVKSTTLRSISNNPNTIMANAIIRGRVTNAITGAGIPSALVNVAENAGWRDSSDASGNYLINLVAPGTFNLVASAQGYFTKLETTFSVAPNSLPYALNFALSPMSSGTISGSAWINNHLVISQVVASTGPSNSLEYVELYNPTNQAFNMGTNLTCNTPDVWMVAWDTSGNLHENQLVYISTSIPANGYYLISNTGDGGGASAAAVCAPMTINGTTVNPDACWRYVGMPNHTLQCNDISSGSGCLASQRAGGLGVGTNGGLIWTGIGNATKFDALAWSGSGTTPSSYETSPATTSDGNGLAPGEAFVRRLDTSTVWSGLYGNSYDSENNNRDFLDQTIIPVAPRTSATLLPPKTGTPATGAIASVTDGISAPSSATLMGNPPYAQFSVPGVATGTWIVFLDSGSASVEVDTVTVTANATTWLSDSVLSLNSTVGTISGRVTDAFGGVISPAIVISVGSANTTVGSTGNYLLRLTTGTYDVTANPGTLNPSYETSTRLGVNVSLGDMTANINYMLSRGGKVSGWVSRDGVNPLPSVSVTAEDSNGTVHDTQVSGTDGRYTLINLTTGTYTVRPVLDSKEISTPASSAVTVLAGTTVSAGTFTVTGAMGNVGGSVTLNGEPIQTGVLIVISTGGITTPPQALSSSTLTGAAYYADSSKEEGTYSVEVRGSTTTTYTVIGFYQRLSGQTPVISSRTFTNVSVTAGQTVTRDFTW